MKKYSQISKVFFAGALAFTILISSCKKEQMGISTKKSTSSQTEKTKRLNANVEKALRNFAEASAGGSSVSSTSGAGGSTFSNPAMNYTTYSTPTANVYVWSDPTSGTVFTLTESTTGGGLGQLAYNGKSFDYNFVLSIKASSNDPNWSGFLSGRDLRGAVAIDGELEGADFNIKNLAIFLVATTGGSGTYSFIDWNATTLSGGDGIGELLDFSALPTPTLASMNDAKFYITSNGHVIVAENSIEMASDAKVTDIATNVEYSINGALMFE
ncbi:MAG: hypothetical protein IPP64_04500 [Bacteroidetes bacterium]|nr:hypothetical protein [Bacteroidota bacterium]